MADTENIVYRCSELIYRIEQEKSEVCRFVSGDIADEYRKLLDLELEKLEKIRRKLILM